MRSRGLAASTGNVAYATPATKRGEATRIRLEEAAVRALDRHGCADIGIREIAAEAGVPVSLFYHYFPGKDALTEAAISRRIAELFDAMRTALRQVLELPPAGLEEAAFAAVLAPTLALAGAYSQNPGMFRCMMQHGETNTGFTHTYHQRRRAWYAGISRWIGRVMPNSSAPESLRLALAWALSGMVDRFLFNAYAAPVGSTGGRFTDPADIARFMAVVWHRILFAASPPSAEAGRFAGIAKLDARRAPPGRAEDP